MVNPFISRRHGLDQPPWNDFQFQLTMGAIVAAVLTICCYYILTPSRRGLPGEVNIPRVGKDPQTWGLKRSRAEFVLNGNNLTKYGYERYKNSLYWIQTGDMDRLVLPNRYVDDLRKLPDGHLDSRLAVVERNLGWYNRVDVILKSTAHVDVCRTQLVQNLGKCWLSKTLETELPLELTRQRNRHSGPDPRSSKCT